MLVQVGNAEMLNCYYAHSEREDGPQVGLHNTSTHWVELLAPDARVARTSLSS